MVIVVLLYGYQILQWSMIKNLDSKCCQWSDEQINLPEFLNSLAESKLLLERRHKSKNEAFFIVNVQELMYENRQFDKPESNTYISTLLVLIIVLVFHNAVTSHTQAN